MDLPDHGQRRRAGPRSHPGAFPGDPPYLMELAGELANSGYDYTSGFEFGLDLVLDGTGELQRKESKCQKRTTQTGR